MKKFFLTLFTAITTFLVSSSSLYSYTEELGDFVSHEVAGFGYGGWITFFYYQFGFVVRGFGGGDIIWLYGEEDLPGMTKRSIEDIGFNEEIRFNEEVHVYVYEADDLAKPNPQEQKTIKRGDAYTLQDLNLEPGRPYIILFRGKSGSVLDVKKIILTEKNDF